MASNQCRSGFAPKNVSISLRGKKSQGLPELLSLRTVAKGWWTDPCELRLPCPPQGRGAAQQVLPPTVWSPRLLGLLPRMSYGCELSSALQSSLLLAAFVAHRNTSLILE